MARAAVIVLALANLGYFAWSTGALAAFGLMPSDLTAREPQRLARQILPGRLRVVTSEQAREEARAQAEAEARTREIRTTASATLAGSDTVIGESDPAVLSVVPAPSDASDGPAPPASTSSASARAAEPSGPAMEFRRPR